MYTVLVNTTTPDQPQPESISIMCDNTTNIAPVVIKTTTTAASTKMKGSIYSETRASPPQNPTDYDHTDVELVSVAAGIFVSLILFAVVVNSMAVL